LTGSGIGHAVNVDDFVGPNNTRGTAFTTALRELRRVLRPDGALVLSRQHPTGDWLRHGGNDFDVRVV